MNNFLQEKRSKKEIKLLAIRITYLANKYGIRSVVCNRWELQLENSSFEKEIH